MHLLHSVTYFPIKKTTRIYLINLIYCLGEKEHDTVCVSRVGLPRIYAVRLHQPQLLHHQKGVPEQNQQVGFT